MKPVINLRKAALVGGLVYIADMIVGNLLWMNPVVMTISERYADHPSTKSMDYFGGMGNWILMNSLFGTLLIVVFIGLYLVLYNSLPGTTWRKGLFFGVMLGIVKAVPEAFNQWMLFVYPDTMIVMQLLITMLSLTLFGVILALAFDRFKVIQTQSDTLAL